ncbi:DUF2254 domain-containing protein [Kitasatospora gansuensis]
MHTRVESLREYLGGALWVLPGVAVVLALVAGSVLSQIDIPPDSPLDPLAFAGTADDARNVLTAIAATMVTVIALVLGLTIVALQVASTQFSPRLLRNFLRDRPNQLVLASFCATFAYSTAGLYTVGISGGMDVEEFPRLAVTGAIALVFVSLVMLVYFVHHVAHSIQIDSVMTSVAAITARGAQTRTPPGPGTDLAAPPPPPHAVPLTAPRSGYLQTVHPDRLLAVAVELDLVITVAARVGDHLVAGAEPLGYAWRPDGAPPGDTDRVTHALWHAVQIGPERTLQQDILFGIRQLEDMALRALSPAINDPYTAVQALDRLAALLALLAPRTLGDTLHTDPAGVTRVIARGPAFADYLDLACGQVRRYGTAEPAVCLALLRLLTALTTVTDDPTRRQAITTQAALVLADAEHRIAQPTDLVLVRELAAELTGSQHGGS